MTGAAQSLLPSALRAGVAAIDDAEEVAFRKAVYALIEESEQRRRRVQHEVPTAFDKSMWQLAILLAKLDPAKPWAQSCAAIPGQEGVHVREAMALLAKLVRRKRAGRYVEYRERIAQSGCDATPSTLAMSSGIERSVSWRGMPLFKMTFDLAIYSELLWDLKPRLVVEIGSGTGAGAIWLADLLRALGIDGEVVSFDVQKLDLVYERVRYVQGDCRHIERDFDARIVSEQTGPVLLLEDAHVNVRGLLDFFHPLLKRGDYVIVEDSYSKRDELISWADSHADFYRVDTRYTDFFGENVTSAQDSIFMRMQ